VCLPFSCSLQFFECYRTRIPFQDLNVKARTIEHAFLGRFRDEYEILSDSSSFQLNEGFVSSSDTFPFVWFILQSYCISIEHYQGSIVVIIISIYTFVLLVIVIVIVIVIFSLFIVIFFFIVTFIVINIVTAVVPVVVIVVIIISRILVEVKIS